MTFESLQVKPEVIKALKEQGIVEPTVIQQKTIPAVHEGKDVVGISRTGSGKTAAFGIPLIELMHQGKGVQGLILAPTRELANQIGNELKSWSKYLGIKTAIIFGGVGLEPQIYAMRESEIVVGTPGRILDHMERGNLTLDKVRVFCLDEADKMVEMGFIQDIEKILGATPIERQILLFGATISDEIDYMKEEYMDNVIIAEAELHVKKDLLKQFYYNCAMNEKFSLLIHLLKKETGRSMIFCSKRSTVELVHKNLKLQGVKAEQIHGKMTQNKRLHVIERFNEGKVDILVASAVAARGLHIDDVKFVYNYDLSNDPQEYVHRVGRTARAGESGVAITLLTPQDHGIFGQVFDRYDIEAEELIAESFPRVRFEVPRRDNRGYGRNRDNHRRHHRR